MRVIDILHSRLRALVRPGTADRELDEELQLHVDRLVEEHIAAGMSPGEAREAARREFGGVQIVEACRDARRVMWIGNAWQDVRYGVRLMTARAGIRCRGDPDRRPRHRRHHCHVQRRLRRPAEAAAVRRSGSPGEHLGDGADPRAAARVRGRREHSRHPGGEPRLRGRGDPAPDRELQSDRRGRAGAPEWVARLGEPVRVLRVAPAVGRTFQADEDELGHERVAILSYGLWQRRFGGDPAIVGRTISLSGEPHVVVGVMRRDFAFPSREYDIYTPLVIDPQDLVDRRNYSFLSVARLKPGITVQQAQAELALLSAQMEREHPKENTGIGTAVVPMLADTVAAVRTPLYVLLAAVAAMLLIGCANLANLLLARALARQRELAVRAALGAARGRLILQSVAELVPMLVAGGALGLFAALSADQGDGAVVALRPASCREHRARLAGPDGDGGHAGRDRGLRRGVAGARGIARRLVGVGRRSVAGGNRWIARRAASRCARRGADRGDALARRRGGPPGSQLRRAEERSTQASIPNASTACIWPSRGRSIRRTGMSPHSAIAFSIACARCPASCRPAS